MTPMLQSMQLPGPPYAPTDPHVRLWSTDPVPNEPKAIGTGRKLLALYDEETTPRTRYNLLLEGRDKNGQVATAALEARLTLHDVCKQYPNYLQSSLLRVFSNEGWTPQLIWCNIPREVRQSSPGACPWAWLDDALQSEMERMLLAEAEGEDLESGQDESVSQESGTPAKGKATPWSAEDSETLFRLKAEGKTHKQIGGILGRSVQGCVSRYAKIKKERQAEATAAAAPAGQNVANPVVVEGADHMASAQIDDPMIVE